MLCAAVKWGLRGFEWASSVLEASRWAGFWLRMGRAAEGNVGSSWWELTCLGIAAHAPRVHFRERPNAKASSIGGQHCQRLSQKALGADLTLERLRSVALEDAADFALAKAKRP
jgi:hypothetical protein